MGPDKGPKDVRESTIVGFGFVLLHTCPYCVTGELPIDIMLPAALAEVSVILLTKPVKILAN